MRSMMICVVLGACNLVVGAGCASVQKMEKDVQAEVKAHPDALKGVEDGALLAAVKAELGKKAKNKLNNIDVAVKGGVVTLKGAASADVKAEVEKLAKVPGVSKIENQIAVK